MTLLVVMTPYHTHKFKSNQRAEHMAVSANTLGNNTHRSIGNENHDIATVKIMLVK
jgi:hypothetical protein